MDGQRCELARSLAHGGRRRLHHGRMFRKMSAQVQPSAHPGFTLSISMGMIRALFSTRHLCGGRLHLRPCAVHASCAMLRAVTVQNPDLCAGALVRVRQRTFLIIQDVEEAPGASPVVHLACVDDDAQGQRLDVIWDAETDARIIPAGRSVLKPNLQPDDPRTFAAYLHALRWGCVTSTDPSLFQAPLRAGIVPKSYQLEPLRKALALPRVNLFIADDVGLGKTIEAGLVLQELLLRQRVQRVVVGCPSSVVLQWRDELLQRLGLSFVVFDKAFIHARRRERGFGINAWTTHRPGLRLPRAARRKHPPHLGRRHPG